MTQAQCIRRFAALGALTIAPLAGALGAAGASGPTVETIQNPTYGPLLASSSGLTLYHLTSETKGAIGCTGACAALWPPLLIGAGAKPTAGTGLAAARLGTIERPGGGLQVTYNGLPLYRYAKDKRAGQALGEGVGGVWFAVGSAGTIVKRAPPASGGYGY